MTGFSLADIKVDEIVVVQRLLSNDSIKRRLQDIGLIQGTVVKCILTRSNESMKAFQIRGAIIAIRKEDAKSIMVEYI